MNAQSRLTASQIARTLRVERVIRAVEQLRTDAIAIEQEYADLLSSIPPMRQESAYNLLHYLAVRRHDIRPLQQDLSLLGLSSLGRMEAHVMATLTAVLETLYQLESCPVKPAVSTEPAVTFEVGQALLADHAASILGATQDVKSVRVMVTMPSEAIDHPYLIDSLLAKGMDIARINCAHDDLEGWAKLVANLRQAESRLGRQCRVAFDLAGPKLRTGPIAPGPEVVKWQPRRNELGQVTVPAEVWLVPEQNVNGGGSACLPVSQALLSQIQVGDTLQFTDARGKHRSLTVATVEATGCRCEAIQTAYVTSGTPLLLVREGSIVVGGEEPEPAIDCRIGRLPAKPQAIDLKPGDILRLIKGHFPGTQAVLGAQGEIIEPPMVSCSLPEVFRDVQPGERIFFDDGKIAGVIRNIEEDAFSVEIVSAANGRAKLRGEKGINLPDTDLKLPALTAKDREDLKFIAANADMVAFSFVQRPADIHALVAELHKLGADHLGIILKIETQRAFNHLPELLLAAMQHPPVAVMVARGDLGVEVGFERLSEVQEEILWLCEAAHVPVIWATQVLESLAKGGMPSRAEVTDAAMGSRAECVMLNKGPYIDQALQFLQDVLYRMQAHQQKKTAMLRKLSISTLEADSL